MLNRQDTAVRNHYISHIKNKCKRVGWRTEEDNKLAVCVKNYTNQATGVVDWSRVHLPERTASSCRSRWLMYLCWKQNDNANYQHWTAKDTVKLLNYLTRSKATDVRKVDWARAIKLIPNGRSEYWLRHKSSSIVQTHVTDFKSVSFLGRLRFLNRCFKDKKIL